MEMRVNSGTFGMHLAVKPASRGFSASTRVPHPSSLIPHPAVQLSIAASVSVRPLAATTQLVSTIESRTP